MFLTQLQALLWGNFFYFYISLQIIEFIYTSIYSGLDNRFDDSPNTPVQSQQQTQSFNGGTGVYTSTTGVRLPNGQVQYTTQTGKF